MKKLLLSIIISIAVAPFINAQALNATFEGTAITDDGWATVAIGSKSSWELASYTGDSQFTSSYLSTNKLGGSQCVRSTTGGYTSMGSVNPSNWLISPKVTVASGDALNFMFAANPVFNYNANITSDDNRYRFEVLVSTTTADTAAFTNRLMVEIPTKITDWCYRSLDLSQFAGQEVYIAFHEYGTPSSSLARRVSQYTYLDNISVTSAVKDLAISRAPEFTSGTETSQDINLCIKNYGAPVSNFTVSCSIDGTAYASEVVTQTLATNDSLVYTFAKKAEFASGDHTIEVSTVLDDDAYTYNDKASATNSILEIGTLPLEVTNENAQDIFTSSYYNYRYGGWSYMADYNGWIYTYGSRSSRSYLYTNKGYALPKGKVKVVLNCTATDDNSVVSVHLTKVSGDYGDAVGSITLSQSVIAADKSFTFDVPEEGNYIIALSGSTDSQIGIFSITFSEPYEDIMVSEITSPTAASLVTNEATVTATVKNDGIQDQSNVSISYQYGDNAVVTETIASIAVGTETEYTFSTKLDLSAAANKTLKVWAHIDNDGNSSNDTIAKSIFTYETQGFPYKTSFEGDDDPLLWTSINVDNDDTYWAVESTPSYAIDGTHTLYLSYEVNVEHKDYAISPAIALKGNEQSRVSFYYGLTTNYGGSKIIVYLVTSPTLEGIKSGTFLGQFDISSTGYHYANARFMAPADGNYYFAILGAGGTDEIFVDDFRVDQATEIAMVDAKLSETDNGYDIANGTVTVSFANCGIADVDDISMTCKASCIVDGDTIDVQSITELLGSVLYAGDTIYCQIQKEIIFKNAGTYTLDVSIASSVDTDTKNNSITIAGPTKFETKSLPYTTGFESTDDVDAMVINSKWNQGSYTPYEGSRSLSHNGTANDTTAGDWAFLNQVYMPAGTYELSFFWRTMANQTGDRYKQRFAVYMGTSATAEGMTMKLAEFIDTTYINVKASKEVYTVTIAEDGNYFIGFKCTTPNSMGYVVIDNVSLKSPETGLAITETAPYTADFAERESEWYHYHPKTTSGSQWTVATNETETYMTAKRTYSSTTKAWTTPSYYEAPVFYLEEGAKYAVTFTYDFATDETADGNSKLNLHIATKDTPLALSDSVLVAGDESYIANGASRGTATATFTVGETGNYYLAFLPYSEQTVTTNLYSFTLSMEERSGAINSIADNNSVIVKRNSVVINGEYTLCSVYAVNGSLVDTASATPLVDLSNLESGIYAVKVTFANGSNVVKKVAITK